MTAAEAGHRERDWLVLAALFAVGQLLVVVAGARGTPLAALPVVLSCGLAVVPLLPRPLLSRRLELVALVPAVGSVVVAITVIGLSRIGVPLREWSLAALPFAVLAVGVAVHLRAGPVDGELEPAPRARVGGAVAAAVLVAASVVAWLLATRATGGDPPTGNDWGKYLLYAEEIRRQGALLIDNPFWLLGVPFREDPGGPAVLGSLLILSDAPAAELAWFVPAAIVAGVLATFGATSLLFGRPAGIAAAITLAVIPAQADMAAWHGLANFVALVWLPLALLGMGLLLRGDGSWRACGLTALGVVGVVAAHRLTTLILVLTLAPLALGALVRAPRATVRAGLRVGACGVVLGGLVAADILARQADSGGVLPYTAYLDTKIVWELVRRDVTWPLAALAVLAVAALVAAARAAGTRARRDPAALLGPALVAATVVYAYSWIAHVPGFYIRAVYFLPLAAAFLVAAGVAAGPLAPRWGLAVAAVAAVLALPSSWSVAADVHAFYDWNDAAALRGYALVRDELAGAEAVVVADRCTAFVAPWLLRTRTLAGLRQSDIGPGAERPRVAEARAVLAGGAAGRRVVARRGVRFALINPRCPGTVDQVPSGGELAYVSTNLLVFRMPVRPAPEAR